MVMGTGGVNWATRVKPSVSTNVLGIDGFAGIVIFWFLSPIISGILAAIMFSIVTYTVLIYKNSYKRAQIFYPIAVGITIWFGVFLILDRATDGSLGDGVANLVDNQGRWILPIIALACGVFAGACSIGFIPIMRKRVAFLVEMQGKPVDKVQGQTTYDQWISKVFYAARVNIHEATQQEHIMAVHANARTFDPETEAFFSYVQIFSCCFVAFAHGSNDVGNAIGPFAAIYNIYINRDAPSRSQVPIWVLVYGGAGIVIGLATYSYAILRVIGIKLIKITPSRGFCLELSAAIIDVLGSYFGIPLSSTHCIVGATIGVGLVEGGRTVNWRMFIKTFLGWIATIIITALISAAVFAFTTGAPSQHQLGLMKSYNTFLVDRPLKNINNTYAEFNATNRINPRLQNFTSLNETAQCYMENLKDLVKEINYYRKVFDNPVHEQIEIYQTYQYYPWSLANVTRICEPTPSQN